MKKYFFKGIVSHRRVKSKKHGFDYPYRSIFLENIYDFHEKRINQIKSSFFDFSFLKNEDSKKILNKKFTVNESFIKLSSVSNSNKSSSFSPNNFNPLLYDFDFESKTGQIYRVDGTDYIINIIPKKLK